MEKFKIDNFKEENPDAEFPAFETLHQEKSTAIFHELIAKVGGKLDPKQLALFLYENSKLLPGTDAEKEKFSLIETLNSSGITPKDSVFINWDCFNQIDKIRLTDLSSHFSDIWYPSADDIDIFDESFSWVLSVFHDGRVGLIKFES